MKKKSVPFDEDYFMRGAESGKSLYQNYRWLANLTIPFTARLAEVCKFTTNDVIQDFGCSRGYIVKALRILGYNAIGVDVSEWAIKNCDSSVNDFVRVGTRPEPCDWIVCKDVLEHIPEPELTLILADMAKKANKGIFIVVPLSPADGEKYVVPEYEMDVTHVIRWPMETWINKIKAIVGDRFFVSGLHRVTGMKDNYARWEKGNGFILMVRA